MRYGIIIRMLALHSTELLIAMKPVLLLWIRVRLQVGSKIQIHPDACKHHPAIFQLHACMKPSLAS